MKRLKCFINRIKARAFDGRIWDGHCWDSISGIDAVYCVDCGKKERV